MKKLLLVAFLFACDSLLAQTFEITGMQETYKGTIGDFIKAPLKLKNTSNRPIILVLKRAETGIGSTQKSFFCPDNTCTEKMDELLVRIEPGQTMQNVVIGLESGLVEGYSTLRYIIYNRSNPTETTNLDVNFLVEPRAEKTDIYTSRFISIHDVYPNPITNYATIDYQLHSEQVKTKIVLHTILGNAIQEIELSPMETRVKISADDLNAGIYFYTLYIDNVGVMTRKLIVKK